VLGVGREGPVGPARRVRAHAAAEWPGRVGGGGSRPPGSPPTGSRLADRDALAVIVSAEGVGPITLERLLAVFGGPNEVLEVARRQTGAADLRVASRDPEGPGSAMTQSAAEALAVAARRCDAVLAAIRAAGVAPLAIGDAAFPERLRRIELPPRVLFVRGDAAPLEALMPLFPVEERRDDAGIEQVFHFLKMRSEIRGPKSHGPSFCISFTTRSTSRP